MSEMLPAKTPAKRRRYSPEFKARILQECQAPEASVANVALRYGLNTNLIHKWRRAAEVSSKPPAESKFIPVPMPMPPPSASSVAEVVFELPGVTVHWPLAQIERAIPWLQMWPS